MNIIIQAIGFKTGETLDSFVRRKLNGLKEDRIVGANVIFSKGPDSTPDNHFCEIKLEVPGNDLFVKKQGKYFETAAAECIDVLTAKLKKIKEKNSARNQAEIVAKKVEVVAGATDKDDLDIDED